MTQRPIGPENPPAVLHRWWQNHFAPNPNGKKLACLGCSQNIPESGHLPSEPAPSDFPLKPAQGKERIDPMEVVEEHFYHPTANRHFQHPSFLPQRLHDSHPLKHSSPRQTKVRSTWQWESCASLSVQGTTALNASKSFKMHCLMHSRLAFCLMTYDSWLSVTTAHLLYRPKVLAQWNLSLIPTNLRCLSLIKSPS